MYELASHVAERLDYLARSGLRTERIRLVFGPKAMRQWHEEVPESNDQTGFVGLLLGKECYRTDAPIYVAIEWI